MPAQSRKSSSRPTRSQRRAGTPAVRHFAYPAANAPAGAPIAPRRFYSAEPAPIDYTREFGFVRHDLRRILIIAGVLILVMIALAVFKLPL